MFSLVALTSCLDILSVWGERGCWVEWRVSASSVQIVSCERVITDPSHPVPPVPSLQRQIGNPVGQQALDLTGLAWTGLDFSVLAPVYGWCCRLSLGTSTKWLMSRHNEWHYMSWYNNSECDYKRTLSRLELPRSAVSLLPSCYHLLLHISQYFAKYNKILSIVTKAICLFSKESFTRKVLHEKYKHI